MLPLPSTVVTPPCFGVRGLLGRVRL